MKQLIRPDVVLALCVASIVGALVVPLPSWLLDGGLALSLAMGATLLVASLQARDALALAGFPTMLLLTTLFRLALSVSSTRLALTEGEAGEVIRAFGEFAVGGDFVVGMVVFAILTLVQLLVVAKGAERVSEVAARFTLDAMPGKQMSVDADLRSGALTQPEARRRRKALERESQLFGAMDGAMKFVKGDTIAGVVIVLVNLLGGTAVGVLSHGMSAGDAARQYALLAIGDGLVAQIPALCTAVAAGFLVTRVAAEEAAAADLGSELFEQLLGEPKVAFIVATLLFALAIVPGLPALPFLAMAIGAALLGLQKVRSQQRSAEAMARVQAETGVAAPPPTAAPSGTASTPTAAQLGVAPLLIDLGTELSAVAQEEGNRLTTLELAQLRDALFFDLGVRVPAIRVRQNAPHLPPDGYQVLIDELPAGSGRLTAGRLFTGASAAELTLLGLEALPAVDPITGRKIVSVAREARGQLEALGAVVRSPRELLLTHVAHCIRKQIRHFLGLQAVQTLLDVAEQRAPVLVREATSRVPVAVLAEVLRLLLDEGISVRHLEAVLEALLDPTVPVEANALAERARIGLRRQLTHRHTAEGRLEALLLDPTVDAGLREGLALSNDGVPALAPDQVLGLLDDVKRQLRGKAGAVLLVAPELRRGLRRLLVGHLPEVAVLTFSELDPTVAVRPVGKVCFAA